ncbi:MAG: lytic transglycosylase domain-containing protein [Bacillota bacterium]
MRTRSLFLTVAFLGLALGLVLAGFQARVHAPAPSVDPGPIGDPGPSPTPDVPMPQPDPLLEPYRQLAAAIQDRDIAVLSQLAARTDGVAYHAHLALARFYRERGESARANTHYAEALSRWVDPAVRREHAASLEQAGDVAGALAAWTLLLPDSAAVEAIGGLADPPAAAAAYRRARLHQAAFQVVQKDTTPAGVLERARAQAALRDFAGAVADFSTYLRIRPDDAQARAEYALALERNRQFDAALAEYGKLDAAGHAGRGRVLQAQGRTTEAIEAFLSSADAEARWRGAQLLELAGNTNRALQVYTELAASAARVADDAALRAYLIQARAGRDAASGQFSARLTPGLAYLAGTFTGHWPAMGPVAPLLPPALDVANALARDYGMDWARIEVEVALRGAAPGQQIAIGQWFLEQGLYNRAAWIGMSLLPQLPAPEVYRLAYPRAYEELVLAASARYQVDPLLVWAVMREESHFQPSVMSWADARGLMQVIPSTGAWIAQKLGEEFVLEQLFDAATSIRYGAWYLSYLLDTYGGDVTAAVAAYNGGPGSVNRWRSSPLYRDPVDLPGVATFQETREYIGKVLASWLAYRWIYGTGSGL